MKFITPDEATAIYEEARRKRHEELERQWKREQEEFEAKMKGAYDYIINDRKDILYEIQNVIISFAGERRANIPLDVGLSEESWGFIKKDEFNFEAIRKFLTDNGFDVEHGRDEQHKPSWMNVKLKHNRGY